MAGERKTEHAVHKILGNQTKTVDGVYRNTTTPPKEKVVNKILRK